MPPTSMHIKIPTSLKPEWSWSNDIISPMDIPNPIEKKKKVTKKNGSDFIYGENLNKPTKRYLNELCIERCSF